MKDVYSIKKICQDGRSIKSIKIRIVDKQKQIFAQYKKNNTSIKNNLKIIPYTEPIDKLWFAVMHFEKIIKRINGKYVIEVEYE